MGRATEFFDYLTSDKPDMRLYKWITIGAAEEVARSEYWDALQNRDDTPGPKIGK